MSSSHTKAPTANNFERTILEFQIRCGAYFHEKRLHAKKTEKEVANHLKISVQTLRDYETGKTGIPLCGAHSLSNYLGIPADEIMELFHELKERIKPTPFYKQDFLVDKGIGAIIKAARDTLSLTSDDIIQLLSNERFILSKDELLRLEAGRAAPSSDFWLHFCRVLHLNLDAVHGYSRWQHLALVHAALKRDEIRIPLNPKVLTALSDYKTALEEHWKKISYLADFQRSVCKPGMK